ncbi:MAG: putative selenate reductase subunit YgfK [Saccharofermentanales bacterium]
MSDRMAPIPFAKLMMWILDEYRAEGAIFGIRKLYRADSGHCRGIFGGVIETPFGPAAGPHTQLAQNIVAAYCAGSRFFELKTVQVLDGEDLKVPKPCILAEDEGYNVEWSTELTVAQAFDEYVKAWFALHMTALEFGLGSADGFVFNMSVGYSLEGIMSDKIDRFIEGLKDAGGTPVFQECMEWLAGHADIFRHATLQDIRDIPPAICRSATLSTLHGCPPQEIGRIAGYLIVEKRLNIFVKCNPTLLGYEYARRTLDKMGYGYVSFSDFHFKDDLQYEDAVPLLRGLSELAASQGLEFGVKVTNTFPVDIKAGELPGTEMYMSGRPLYPLSMAVAARLSADFGGRLRISFSGGADYFNISGIIEAGIWPVTMATTALKPGGYERFTQIAEALRQSPALEFTGVDAAKVQALVQAAESDRHHIKTARPHSFGKLDSKVPLVDCFIAPCKEGCPIHQDITAYLQLAGEGRMKEALEVITGKNPLPFITGTICGHDCMGKCTRNFYETPVNIRRTKLEAARGGFEDLLQETEVPSILYGKKAAVVGGGPAGLAAAYFLARGGMETTLYEKEAEAGGVVRHLIPDFRIPAESIDQDIRLVRAMGVRIVTGMEITDVGALRRDFDYVILAVGASDPGILGLDQGQAIAAADFLKEFKKCKGHLDIGSRIAVVGGGNTAMDTARAAIRTSGVEKVSLVYRRTRQYMPAVEEELFEALEDGVEFLELLSPLRFEDGVLHCSRMKLTVPDADGRRGAAPAGDIVQVPADTVIAAIGEKVPTRFYQDIGLAVDSRGRARVSEDTLETSLEGIYVIGDGLNGPASVVEGIRDAMMAAGGILKKQIAADCRLPADQGEIYRRKADLSEEDALLPDSRRCLGCDSICENCVQVCPNRANVSISVSGLDTKQIVHLDAMCNECGNCAVFCPYDSAPYLDKFTLFADEASMEASRNEGAVVLDSETGACRIRLDGRITDDLSGEGPQEVPAEIRSILAALIDRYPYLL